MLEIAAKALLGAALVVAFALVSEIVTPKRFAGVFSAAPSIALGSLVVTVLAQGRYDAAAAARGMLAGAVGFAAYAAITPVLLRRLRPLPGSAAGLVLWLGMSALAYQAVTA